MSWFKPHLDPSLSIISKLGLNAGDQIIDVGAGASTLVDDLLERKLGKVTVLDISGKALDISRKRLGARADEVTWLAADITRVDLPKNHYDLWHDRAVFHFLTSPTDRAKYIEALRSSLKAGGDLIIATFGLNGPPKCSGLDIVRYSAQTLSDELGGAFELVESFDESHKTPSAATQNFVYGWFKKSAP